MFKRTKSLIRVEPHNNFKLDIISKNCGRKWKLWKSIFNIYEELRKVPYWKFFIGFIAIEVLMVAHLKITLNYRHDNSPVNNSFSYPRPCQINTSSTTEHCPHPRLIQPPSWNQFEINIPYKWTYGLIYSIKHVILREFRSNWLNVTPVRTYRRNATWKSWNCRSLGSVNYVRSVFSRNCSCLHVFYVFIWVVLWKDFD